MSLLLYIAIFALTFFGVMAMRRWAITDSLIDKPNERSSHTSPTPKGGGVIIVLVSLVAINIYALFISGRLPVSFTIGAMLVACVSLIDDLRDIHPFLRLSVHGVAASVLIFGLGAYQLIDLPVVGTMRIGILGVCLSFVWIVWFINAFNFMDGIDGIAGLQAVVSAGAFGLVGWLFGAQDVFVMGMIISASSLGFLAHNWSPAKIFMGDVGSAFLGYCLAGLPLMLVNRAGNYEGKLPFIAVGLVWVFVFDALLTLTVRLIRREKLWKAHREHIYQKLVHAGASHRLVATAYGAAALIGCMGVLAGIEYVQHFTVVVAIAITLATALPLTLWIMRHRGTETTDSKLPIE